MQDTEMVPYSQKSFGSPDGGGGGSTRSNSPTGIPMSSPQRSTDLSRRCNDDNVSDDEISVGCPSPALTPKNYEESNNSRVSYNEMDDVDDTEGDDDSNQKEFSSDDYFKPLKRLKMINLAAEKRISSPTVEPDPDLEPDRTSEHGVKSFSIMDILNHRPTTTRSSQNSSTPARIVRPWDLEPETPTHPSALNPPNPELIVHHHHHPHPVHHPGVPAHMAPHHAAQHFERFHRQLKAAQHLALLRPDFAASYTSETGSDRSSSVTSDCCSPDIVPTSSSTSSSIRHNNNNSSSNNNNHRQQAAGQKGPPGSTPLDALFQMTSKTFDSNNGEASGDGQNSHLNLFNNRQQPKKKRKSRTAFTNHQIFELEKRFLYQKYLSPADRDEIAASLGLSNAQVITWFQNRRAKLKRDMEELKKDVESAKILTAHKSFLENVQDLGILKKKALVNNNLVVNDECPKNLVIAHEK